MTTLTPDQLFFEKAEIVREMASEAATSDDDELDFYGASLAFGLDDEAAEEVDVYLTSRVMTARGAI